MLRNFVGLCYDPTPLPGGCLGFVRTARVNGRCAPMKNPMSTFGKRSAGRWYQNTQIVLPHKVVKKKKSPAYEHIKRNETRRSGSTVNRMTIMEAPEGYAPAYEHIKRNETRRSGSIVNRMIIVGAPKEGWIGSGSTVISMIIVETPEGRMDRVR